MTRFTLLFAALACGTSVAQSFDVASVKFTSHGRTADGWSHSDLRIVSPGRLVGTNASLHECIAWAYRLKDYQLFGPEWLGSDAASYDIEAKAPPDTSEDGMRLMFQTLLRERFQLAVHRETRKTPVYLLIVSKKGPHMISASVPSATLWSRGSADQVGVTGESATMASLANRLSRDLDRPVFDRTGIAGAFRIDLQWARMGNGPSVFAAVEEQLGLKLQPSKEPIDVVVVDHAERVPRAN